MDGKEKPQQVAPGFEQALAEMQVAVEGACGREGEWPAGVGAAICAAFRFAAADPAAARALTVEPLLLGREGGRRWLRVIEHFAELLRARAPRRDLPITTENALVGGLATIIADHLRSKGQVDDLLATAPELIEFTLLPYLGRSEAREWARRFSLPEPPPSGA